MLDNICIVGTSHISKDSITKIKQKLEEFKPDVMAVELDVKRYHSLMSKPSNKEQKTNIFMIGKIGMTGYLFMIIGRWAQKKLGSIVGVEPGADMKAAVDLCRKKKLLLALIDRDISITLKRLSKKFSFKEKMKMLRDLLLAPFSRKKVSLDLSKIPKKDFIKKILLELKQKYPNIYGVLIDERNKYMAKKLFKILKDDKKVLCVVGAGHEEGLVKDLKSLYYSNISKE